jgi:hypothetical protein
VPVSGQSQLRGYGLDNGALKGLTNGKKQLNYQHSRQESANDPVFNVSIWSFCQEAMLHEYPSFA